MHCMQTLLADSTTDHLWKEGEVFMQQMEERKALAQLLKAVSGGDAAAESKLHTLTQVKAVVFNICLLTLH